MLDLVNDLDRFELGLRGGLCETSLVGSYRSQLIVDVVLLQVVVGNKEIQLNLSIFLAHLQQLLLFHLNLRVRLDFCRLVRFGINLLLLRLHLIGARGFLLVNHHALSQRLML